MHNKRMVLPLTTRHLPTLTALVPTALRPRETHRPESFPASKSERQAAEARTRKDDARRRLCWDWSENALTMVWCLAEASSSKILSTLNANLEVILPFLVAFLGGDADDEMATDSKKKVVPSSVAVVAAQALHALISQNAPALSALTRKHASTLDSLRTVLTQPSADDDSRLLRVLAFGILQEAAVRSPAVARQARTALRAQEGVLTSVVATTDVHALVKEACDVEKERRESQAGPQGAEYAEASERLAAIERKLSTLQLALEILAEWVTMLDDAALDAAAAADDEEWTGINDEDEDMVDETEMIIQREREPEPEVEPEATLELDDQAVDLFRELPVRLLALADPSTPLSFMRVADESEDGKNLMATSTEAAATVSAALASVTEHATAIHVRAVEAMSNVLVPLARALDEDVPAARALLEGTAIRSALQTVWERTLGRAQQAIAAPVDESLQEQRREYIDASLGVAWGLARLGASGDDAFLSIGPSTTPFLIEQVLPSTESESVRVRVAGTLAFVGRRPNIPVEENARIGAHLFSLLPSANAPELLVQAVDSLIDVYADEEREYDAPVFRAGGFLAKLQELQPAIRAAVRKIDRKRFGELRKRADGALENLAAFIKYRQQLA